MSQNPLKKDFLEIKEKNDKNINITEEITILEKRLEKKIKEEVLREVMERVNPFLLTLQKASNQHLHNNAALKAKEIEDGIKSKIENRMQYINNFMDKRKQ